MLITDIYWERIYLHIKVGGETSADGQYILTNKDNGKSCPLSFFEKNSEIVLNITNTPSGEMLPEGEWRLNFLGADGKSEAVELSDDVCRKLPSMDKAFWYAESTKACVFSLIPDYSEGGQTFFIRNFFMKKDRKPHKRFTPDKNAPVKRKLHSLLGNFVGKCLNILYQLLSAFCAKKGNRILLMSENREMGGNLKALDDRLKGRGLDKKYKISYHFAKALDSKGFSLFAIWFRLVFQCAKQDYIFIDDYEPFFEHINLSKKTKLIQLWHAGVGFKSVGYSRFGMEGSCHPFVSSHRKYDYAVVGGEALRDVYSEVFGIAKEKCLPFGLLRTDGYTAKENIDGFRECFFEKNPQLKNKKIILFAPTFRGDSIRTAHYPFDIIDQKRIYDMCGEDKAFLFKMHPFIDEKIQIKPEFASRIFDFSDFGDINSLFYAADVLVTDYSSSIYEFAMLGKPMLFFAFDREKYEMQRSLHRSLEEYAPGKLCKTFDELLISIQNEDFEKEKLEGFVRENVYCGETGACDKVIEYILGEKL